MAYRFSRLEMRLTHDELLAWVRERRENCLRIANQKSHEEKEGWLEDAWYFQEIENALSGERHES